MYLGRVFLEAEEGVCGGGGKVVRWWATGQRERDPLYLPNHSLHACQCCPLLRTLPPVGPTIPKSNGPPSPRGPHHPKQIGPWPCWFGWLCPCPPPLTLKVDHNGRKIVVAPMWDPPFSHLPHPNLGTLLCQFQYSPTPMLLPFPHFLYLNNLLTFKHISHYSNLLFYFYYILCLIKLFIHSSWCSIIKSRIIIIY